MKQSPQWVYERVYCQRGDVETRIKELHDWKLIAPVAPVFGPTSFGFCSPRRVSVFPQYRRAGFPRGFRVVVVSRIEVRNGAPC